MKLHRCFVLVLALCAATAFGQTPDHAYEFNGSLADTYGGPPMIADGGALNPGSYAFAPNQGLNVSNVLASTSTYSIEMYFELQAVTSYRKLVDFNDRTQDTGLYSLNGVLVFYNLGGGVHSLIQPNTPSHVVLTRDGGSNMITGYLDGVQEFQLSDPSGQAVFSSTGGIMRFFEDDNVTGGNESSAGSVDFIHLYNHVLTPTDVANLYAAVPEPTSLAVLALGGLALLRRRRR